MPGSVPARPIGARLAAREPEVAPPADDVARSMQANKDAKPPPPDTAFPGTAWEREEVER